MENLLEIRGLEVEFLSDSQVVKAVNGLGLDIARDEVLVLAGESGSGKTVASLSITRNLPAKARISAGSIKFRGKDLLALNRKELDRIRGSEVAYIFQEPVSFLNPLFTVGNQIMEAIALHQGKSKKEAYDEALTLLGLVKIKDPERVSHNYPHQLSGGMNQRVFIAMALACRPKLLIADEPTTSLDAATEKDILKLLLELKKKFKFSLLFITHNLSIAKRIADRVCVMFKGEIVEEGAPEGVFGAPKHAHTRELIQAYNKIGV